MPFDPARSYTLILRHGLPAVLRQLTPGDRDRVREACRRLSPESAYLRFWTRFRQLNPAFIDRLLAPADPSHAAWILTLSQNNDIPGVGGASFWRLQDAPDSAEVSFTIADEFQNQGNGTLLLAALWLHARSSGITRFVAHVLDENLVMRAWWDALGAVPSRNGREWLLSLPLDTSLLSPSNAAISLRHWLQRLSS